MLGGAAELTVKNATEGGTTDTKAPTVAFVYPTSGSTVSGTRRSEERRVG